MGYKHLDPYVFVVAFVSSFVCHSRRNLLLSFTFAVACKAPTERAIPAWGEAPCALREEAMAESPLYYPRTGANLPGNQTQVP
jgi:hypothetical protein